MQNKWSLEGVEVDINDNMIVAGTIESGGVIFPSTDPLIAGAWWDDAGTLTKSAG